MSVLRESCQQYFKRRMSEGWTYKPTNYSNVVEMYFPDGRFARTLDLRGDIETIRPNGVGSCNDFTPHGATYNWQCVDEVSQDGSTTYNSSTTTSDADLFALDDTVGSGAISKITVYMWADRSESSGYNYIRIKSGSTEDTAQVYVSLSGYAEYSADWTTDPNTSSAWTWLALDSLEAGYSYGETRDIAILYVTQVYVEIDYVATVAPTVITQTESNVAQNSVRINGKVSSDGGDPGGVEARFRWRIKQDPVLDDTESFETDLGDWVNDLGNVSDWVRLSGPTGSSGTGPSAAYDGDYYIYVETSSGYSYSNGDTDIIEYNIGSTKAGYVDFYYHQYGGDQGTLYFEGYDSTWHTIWSSSGNQGDQWNHVTSASTSWNAYSKIRFRNVAAGGFEGDVALDLVKVYTGPGWTETSWQNTMSTNDTYYEDLSSLMNSTTYEYQTQGRNAAGDGEWSTSEEFTTLDCSDIMFAQGATKTIARNILIRR